MPSLESLHQEFLGQSFVLLGIDIEENKDTVIKHVRSNNLSFPNLLDKDGQVSMIYGVRSTPTKVILDRRGYLVGIAMGYKDWNTEEVRSLIRHLINAG